MNNFKSIDEAIQFIAQHKHPGNSRALRTISFVTNAPTETNDVIASILGTLSEFQFKSTPGEDPLQMQPGEYEAVIVVHVRAIEPSVTPILSGVIPDLPS